MKAVAQTCRYNNNNGLVGTDGTGTGWRNKAGSCRYDFQQYRIRVITMFYRAIRVLSVPSFEEMTSTLDYVVDITWINGIFAFCFSLLFFPPS